MEVLTRSVEETLALGRLVGRLCPVDGVTCIALEGELGAGKTHFTRGIAEGAGGTGVEDPSLVSSPTYVLMNVYPAGGGGVAVYHLDAYRVSGVGDFEAVGFEEILSGNGIVVVEWASRVAGALPGDRVEVRIEHEGEGARVFRMEGLGERSLRLVGAVEGAWKAGEGSE